MGQDLDLRAQARAYGEKISRQFEDSHGDMTDAAQDLIGMLVDLEALYLEAKADLDRRGLREPYHVSKYNKESRENKSFAPFLKLQTQKARLLRELRLLPGGRKADPPDREDKEDQEKEDLDDY